MGLSDGNQYFEGKEWSSFYITCKQNRTITISQCKTGYFNPRLRVCTDSIDTRKKICCFSQHIYFTSVEKHVLATYLSQLCFLESALALVLNMWLNGQFHSWHHHLGIKSSICSALHPQTPHENFSFNSLENRRILDLSKLRAFGADKLNILKMMIFVFGRVESIVGKGKMPKFNLVKVLKFASGMVETIVGNGKNPVYYWSFFILSKTNLISFIVTYNLFPANAFKLELWKFSIYWNTVHPVYLLALYDKILAWSKLQAFADNKMKETKIMNNVFLSLTGWKTLWEKEKMLVTIMFSKGFLYRAVKKSLLWGKD